MSKLLFILHIPPPLHGASIVGSYIHNSININQKFAIDYINLSTSFELDEIGKYKFSKLYRLFILFFNIVFKNFNLKYDMCYLTITLNGKAFYRDLIIVLLLRLFGNKVVLHLHNKGASSYNSIVRKFGYRYVFNSNKVILLSDLLYKDIKKYVTRDQIFICPNGIPDRRKLTINKKSNNEYINILFLSNIIINKGVLILLEACVKLKERKLKFLCHFVGGWKDLSQRSTQELISKKGLENSVFFYGPKYHEEKNEYFESADIFIHPTLEDCFPLNILEAMQNNLPVISTYEGGIPNIVIDGETGFLCPKNDIDCLVEKIELLINNPELRTKMGENGRKRYEENFTLEHFENRFVNILRAILNEES